MPAERLLFRLAGPFAVTDGRGRALTPTSTKAQCALAYLALQPRHSASRQTLMGLLWSNRALPQAQASLRMCLFEIRTALKEQAALLRSARGEVGLDPDRLAVDVAELLERTRGGQAEPDPPWSGSLLSNLDGADPQFDEWLFLERSRLRDAYRGTLEARSRQAADRLDWRQAATLASRLLQVDPTRESAHRLLITSFAEQGDIGAALRQHELLREVLARMLDARPSEATEALIRELKAGRYVRRGGALGAAPDRAAAAELAVPLGGRLAGRHPASYPHLAIDNTAPPAGGPAEPRPASPAAAEAAPQERLAIAVLPFETLGGDPQQQLFSDGICEDIIADLSRFREIFVIGRHTAFQYRGTALQPRRIAAELGVQYLLQGTVRHAGSRVRVSVQLVRAGDGATLWTERFDRSLEDIFAVQDEVTRMIVASTAAGIEHAELAAGLRQRPDRVQAYDLWLRGKRALNGWTKADLNEARQLFAAALEIDGAYARAHAGLALTYEWGAFYSAWEDATVADSRAAAERHALAAHRLDPTDSQPLLVLAWVCHMRGEYERARQYLDRAERLNPNDADLLINEAMILSLQGRAERAVALGEAAVRLNPHHPDWYRSYLSSCYFSAHRFADALALTEGIYRVFPETHAYVAVLHELLGQHAAAAARIAAFVAEFPAHWRGRPSARFCCELMAWEREEERRLVHDALRRAGLPD